ncbi:MAG TPA: ABC transporter permease [Burkholderiales bacterium]|nr:ABC transporter permease [Burkholderiales bacterium]
MREQGVWALAWKRFRRDRLGFASLIVVLVYVAIMLSAAAGWLGRDWNAEAGVSFAPPSFLGPEAVESPQLAKAAEGAQAVADYGIADPLAPDLTEIAKTLSGESTTSARAVTLPLGGDKWGRDVLKKVLKGTQTSLVVGLSAAALAAFLGTLFGALAGFRGGWVDDFFNWLYSVFTSIPYLLLVLAIAAVVNQKGTFTVILILGLTGWTGIFRLIRAEYLKHRVREYVLAADAIGASGARRMFVHILPNVSHVVLVQLSICVVLFIKSEVILTFLGFGVGVDTVSWGSMLAEAGSELLLGKWWQLTAATVAMAILVTAFSLFTDAMRDALDPRLK